MMAIVPKEQLILAIVFWTVFMSFSISFTYPLASMSSRWPHLSSTPLELGSFLSCRMSSDSYLGNDEIDSNEQNGSIENPQRTRSSLYNRRLPNRRNRHSHQGSRDRNNNRSSNKRRGYLESMTANLLDEQLHPRGSMVDGKWRDLRAVMDEWSSFKPTPNNPMIVEALLKRLIDERTAGNEEVEIHVDAYNVVVDAWARLASISNDRNRGPSGKRKRGSRQSILSHAHNSTAAAARAEDIVRGMQAEFEASMDASIRPDGQTFLTVLGAWTKSVWDAPDPSLAVRSSHRFLRWMRSLHKSGRNDEAKPGVISYSLLMDAYAKSGSHDAGAHAERILKGMTILDPTLRPNSFCYNAVINAYARQGQTRFEGAETVVSASSIKNAERVLGELEMLQLSDKRLTADRFSYTTVITAWANAGRGSFGAERAEQILNRMEQMEASTKVERKKMQEQSRRFGRLSPVGPSTVTYNAVLKAWCRSDDPQASQKAEALLNRMEQRCDAGYKDSRPDRVSFNTFIHILSKEGTEAAAQRAEAMLRKMEELEDSGFRQWSPNVFTYNQVIEAWSNTGGAVGAQRAKKVLLRLLQRGMNNARTPKPDAYSYNLVIFALAKSDGAGAALKAEELLSKMENDPEVRPDVYGYSSTIHAWSRSGRKDSGARAETLLERMEQISLSGMDDIKPNTVTYNSVIDAWAKSDAGVLGARKAEKLLKRMEEAHLSGDLTIKPNSLSYNSVLSAWARSGTRCAHRKAGRLVERMWKLYHAGDKDVKPDGCSYNTLINAVSKSHNEKKAQKALGILRSMDVLYKSGGADTRPNEFTYTSVLNSCAFTFVDDERTKRKALETAIFTLEQLRGSPDYARPNHVMYATFLKVCTNLVDSDNEQRRRLVEDVFVQCRQEGQVGDIVLAQLRDAAPADLFEALMEEAIDDSPGVKSATITIQDLPVEWRCNVHDEQQSIRTR